ncbi:HNH endonuclease signature motif containing protein [Nocardiopsis salina]|uniref:HNH endonuclease signature motif containing protein n=1 Tax=Nocardiopsis salina TaxID=245836 RepID=UPI00034D0D0E|nr:HNH endonuclease signature motif containing protein [Nocardiopsis salina]
MTNHTAAAHTGPGNDPVAARAFAAVQEFAQTFQGDIPFGAAGEMIARVEKAHALIETLTLATLSPLAAMESSGELLHSGGQKNVETYLTHARGIGGTHAKPLGVLARGLHEGGLPLTSAALEEGAVSVGEAAAIAVCVKEQTNKRDTAQWPQEAGYRARIETGLVGLKRERPRTSVATLKWTAHRLGAGLCPGRAEKDEQAAFEARGARLSRGFEGDFHFTAWGPASDAERFQAALDSFTAPVGSEADGGVVRAKSTRTYDALLAAAGFAHGHHGCAKAPGPKAYLNITVPLATFQGQSGSDAAVTGDGHTLALSQVRALAAESIMRRLVFDPGTGRTLDLGRGHRLAPKGLREAAFAGHTRCAWDGGCDVPASWCEADHIVEFSAGGTTSLDNLQPLCRTHNRLKYRHSIKADHRAAAQQKAPKAATGAEAPTATAVPTATAKAPAGSTGPPGEGDPPTDTGPPPANAPPSG